MPHTAFPVLMMAGGRAMPVGAAQSAVALAGGAALAALAARLDGTNFLVRARRSLWAVLAGCVALAALVSYATPVDTALVGKMVGRRPRGPAAAAQPAAGGAARLAAPAASVPLAPRRTRVDSDAEFARAFGVEPPSNFGGRRGRGMGKARAGGGNGLLY
jgi:hypothetical protein